MSHRKAIARGAAAPWWEIAGQTCVAAYQPKGAASLADSYTNLANPGVYDAVPGVAPTWDAIAGWIFNGSTQYLATGVLAAQYMSAIVRFSDVTTQDRHIFGSTDGNAYFAIVPRWTGVGGGVLYAHGNLTVGEGQQGGAGQLTTGVLALTAKGFRDGVPDSAACTGWSGSGLSIYIGGRNQSGSLANPCGSKIEAFALYSALLSDGEIATLSAAMAAL